MTQHSRPTMLTLYLILKSVIYSAPIMWSIPPQTWLFTWIPNLNDFTPRQLSNWRKSQYWSFLPVTSLSTPQPNLSASPAFASSKRYLKSTHLSPSPLLPAHTSTSHGSYTFVTAIIYSLVSVPSRCPTWYMPHIIEWAFQHVIHISFLPGLNHTGSFLLNLEKGPSS